MTGDATFKVVTELPDGPERTGESETCSTLDTASVKVHRFRCECYGNEVTVRGAVYSISCLCKRLLEPLRGGATDISGQQPQKYEELEVTYSATEAARALTAAGFPVSDVTVAKWCRGGTVPGAEQEGYSSSWQIPQHGLSTLKRRLSEKQAVLASENFGYALPDGT